MSGETENEKLRNGFKVADADAPGGCFFEILGAGGRLDNEIVWYR